jgi:hypothetical protein
VGVIHSTPHAHILGAYLLGAHVTTEFSSEIGWIVLATVVLFVLYQVLQRFVRTAPQRSH